MTLPNYSQLAFSVVVYSLLIILFDTVFNKARIISDKIFRNTKDFANPYKEYVGAQLIVSTRLI